jgi:hypothetical protein
MNSEPIENFYKVPAREEFIHAPKRVTVERWDEMLNVLPPMYWRSGPGSESFKMIEFDCYDITTIFCRIGSDYYELSDSAGLSHAAIVAKCRAVAP